MDWQEHAKTKVALHKWLLDSLGEEKLQRRLAADVKALDNARIVNDGKA